MIYSPTKTGLLIGYGEYSFAQYETTDRFDRRITFYITESDETLPLVLYIAGSGGGSLFKSEDGLLTGTSCYDLYLDAIAHKARLLIVERPGVHLYEQPKHWGSSEGCSQEFLREHTLERWSEASNAAVEAALTLAGVNKCKLLAAGHSEGARTVSHLAGYNHNVTHVAAIGGGGPTQLFDMTYFACTKDDLNEQERSTALESVFEQWNEIKTDSTSTEKFWMGHPYNRWYSFFSSSPLENLLTSKAKIYLAHGTADTAVPITSFDILRAELSVKNKELVAERLVGADHGLMIHLDGERKNELPNVIRRILNWYLTG